jgi:hypothetical protein
MGARADWDLQPDEIKQLAGPLAEVLSRLQIGKALEKYSAPTALGIACVTIFGPRLLAEAEPLMQRFTGARAEVAGAGTPAPRAVPVTAEKAYANGTAAGNNGSGSENAGGFNLSELPGMFSGGKGL